MSPILVLGGTGAFGRLIVGDLLIRSPHHVTVASRRGIPHDAWPAGSEGRLTSQSIDVTERAELFELVERIQPSVIVHAAGSYFTIGSVPLEVALASRTPYVDLCPRAYRYVELQEEFGEQAITSGVPVILGASTVGGVTGLLTRRATDRLNTVDSIQTALSVHNFSWSGGLVNDYLRSAGKPTKLGRPGSVSQTIRFPDDTNRSVALGDTLEHVLTEGLCTDTTHWFGLDAVLPTLAMRMAEWLTSRDVPVWRAAGLCGWLAGRLGGDRTVGILIHDAKGTMAGESGTLRTTVIRPFGNIRNPAVLAAITAAEIANGEDLGRGFVHPASWMDPERIIKELTDRANRVKTDWVPD